MTTPSPQPPANKPPAPPKAPGQPESHDAWEHAMVITLKNTFQDAVIDAKEYAKEITVTIDKEKLLDICAFLKKTGFTYLIDIVGLHFPKEEKPFTLVYYLHHMKTQERIRLKLRTNENDPVASVTGIWKTSNWMEREAFDMFGIQFSNHPNLKRILMWDDFNGHPLRKDFPLLGIDTGAAIYQDVYPQHGGPILKQITPKKDA